MAWAWRNDEKTDFKLGKEGGGNGVVADNGDCCAKQRKLLVEIPSEGVKVVYHEHIELAGQRSGESRGRHCARRPSGLDLADAAKPSFKLPLGHRAP